MYCQQNIEETNVNLCLSVMEVVMVVMTIIIIIIIIIIISGVLVLNLVCLIKARGVG